MSSKFTKYFVTLEEESEVENDTNVDVNVDEGGTEESQLGDVPAIADDDKKEDGDVNINIVINKGEGDVVEPSAKTDEEENGEEEEDSSGEAYVETVNEVKEQLESIHSDVSTLVLNGNFTPTVARLSHEAVQGVLGKLSEKPDVYTFGVESIDTIGYASEFLSNLEATIAAI